MRSKPTKTVSIQVRITPAQHRRWLKLASMARRKLSDLIRVVVDEEYDAVHEGQKP